MIDQAAANNSILKSLKGESVPENPFCQDLGATNKLAWVFESLGKKWDGNAGNMP